MEQPLHVPLAPHREQPRTAARALSTVGAGRRSPAVCVCIRMVVDLDIFRYDAGLCVDCRALEFLRPFHERPSPCILDSTSCVCSLSPWRGL